MSHPARAGSLGAVLAAAALALPAAASAAPTFGPATTYGGLNEAYGLAYGDITGDGVGDAVVTERGNAQVAVLPGTVGGGFGAQAESTVGAYPQAVGLGDFDGDSHLDVATANFTPGSFSVLLNSAAGGLEPATTTDVTPDDEGDTDRVNDIVVADFDGDGRDDLAISGYANGSPVSGRVVVALSSADGSFPLSGRTTYYIGSNRSGLGLAAGDLDADGDADLVITGYGRQDLTTLRNAGDGTFDDSAMPSYNASSATMAVTLTDVDSDGDLDAAYTYATADIGVFGGLGNGTFATPPATFHEGTGQQSRDIAAADLDGDGRVDLATADMGSRAVTVWPNGGPAGFGPGVQWPVGNASEYTNYPSNVVLADLDGDGKADLLSTVQYSASAGLTVRRNTTPFRAQATTAAASDVTATSATLHATVDPRDSDATWHFAYGTAADPTARKTADVTVVAGSGSAPVSAQVTGLEPQTTYHARVEVLNGAGETVGQDVTFTTTAAPPADTTTTSTETTTAATTATTTTTTTTTTTGAPSGPVVPTVPTQAAPVTVKGDQAQLLTSAVKAFGKLDTGQLAKAGGVSPTFRAREAGKLTIDGSVSGTVRAAAAAKSVSVLHGAKTFAKAGTAKVKLKLSARGRKALAKSGRLKLTLRATWAPAAGTPVTSQRTVTLKVKRVRKKR